MIKASIAGGTGYTAGELIRILVNHPQVEIESVLSTTSAGMEVWEIHRDLIGETSLKFTEKPLNPDVMFLCLGHGISREFLNNTALPDRCRIIDLGNDFRLEPEFGDRHFVYGLTDTFKQEIVGAECVANPGCFATAIQSALIPLAKAGLLRESIEVTAITGATGAGKKLSETGHFCYRDNNLSIYKLFKHQHLGEINRTLERLMGHKPPRVNFVPIRGDFPRGIFASLYTKWYGKVDATELFIDYYKESPFVFISQKGVSLKEVINTNRVLLHIEVIDGYIHICSVIDNLIKGAGGQAVENMNLMFGLEQTAGLKLKPSAF